MGGEDDEGRRGSDPVCSEAWAGCECEAEKFWCSSAGGITSVQKVCRTALLQPVLEEHRLSSGIESGGVPGLISAFNFRSPDTF